MLQIQRSRPKTTFYNYGDNPKKTNGKPSPNSKKKGPKIRKQIIT